MRVRADSPWPKGKLVRLEHKSQVLKHNPWDDPSVRELPVYLPPGYEDLPDPCIALWDFAAFTNSGPGHTNWRNHGENLIQRLDRLIAEQHLPPVIVPMPDCYSSLGGNQYVNSSAVGQYADYVVEELVPLVSSQFNVYDQKEGRGVFGKSSGGYGALYHAMHYPEIWGAAASHAGDAGFEWVYRVDFPKTCQVLSRCNGDVIEFIRQFWRKKHPGSADFHALLVIAMAASYDPDPESEIGFNLPFDLHTCVVDEARWDVWKRYDPVVMAKSCEQALQSLCGLYIDVGGRDQYNIQYGSRQLTQVLQAMNIDHIYEEFDGTHSGIDWRLDHSLPYLASRLQQALGIDT